MPALSSLTCLFLPSRYQEVLKKTKELQDLTEEEEEQKSESPEEPEEAEETREEEKEQRSRLEPSPLLNLLHCTTSLEVSVPGGGGSGAHVSSQQKPRGHLYRRRQKETSQRAKRVNRGMFARAEGSGVVKGGAGTNQKFSGAKKKQGTLTGVPPSRDAVSSFPSHPHERAQGHGSWPEALDGGGGKKNTGR